MSKNLVKNIGKVSCFSETNKLSTPVSHIYNHPPISIKFCNITTRLSYLLDPGLLVFSLNLLELLPALFSSRIDNALLQTKHATVSKLLHHLLGLLHAHLAQNLVDFVQRLRGQGLPQILGEGFVDLASFNFDRFVALLCRDIDGDFGVRVNGVQLDLLDAGGVVAALRKLGGAGLDLVVGFVDIVAE